MLEKIAQGVNIGEEYGSEVGTGDYTIGNLVRIFIEGAMVVAGIIFLFLIIGGGISLISGAGSGNKEAVAKGKQAVTSALIGFIIIFASYWIIQLIEIITGIPFITNPF
ncbi:hypothetical protein JXA63_02305 [Candidatus Woesebacteria bacterium]|nr:hypothetical protein [Candidatus Woesebacteria bacterium]